MKRRIWTLSVVLIVAVTAFAVWARAGAAQTEETYTIGVSYQGLSVPFIKALQNAARAQAKKLGNVTLVEADSNFNVNTELTNVQTLLSRGVQCLAIEAVSVRGSVGAVEAANARNVPVIEFNSGTKGGGKVVAFVGADHYYSGELLGEFVTDLYQKSGKSTLSGVYLRGVPGQVTDTVRTSAVKATVEAAGLTGQIEFNEQHADFDRGKSQQVIESIISSGKPMDFIIANGDDMILGACEALTAHGMDGKVPMSGIDGLPEVLKGIEAGKITATVFQDPEPQGAGGVDFCVRHLQGQPLPEVEYIPFVLTTKANVDAIAKIANRVYPK